MTSLVVELNQRRLQIVAMTAQVPSFSTRRLVRMYRFGEELPATLPQAEALHEYRAVKEMTESVKDAIESMLRRIEATSWSRVRDRLEGEAHVQRVLDGKA